MRELGVVRRLGIGFAIASIGVAALALGSPSPVHARDRVVVLGFDGADAALTEQWMDEGHLPNLAALRDRGAFRPLMPTNPPQTPVSWSTFATGMDPGHTEIFDFLKRVPDTYLPDFALQTPVKTTFLWGDRNPMLTAMIGLAVGFVVLLVLLALLRLRGRRLVGGAAVLGLLAGGAGWWFGATYLPEAMPIPVNHRQGQTFWDYAAERGVTTRTIRVPATFPASEVAHGTMISGLGVPDIRGRIGTPAMYTSEEIDENAYADFSVEVVNIPRRGAVNVDVFGPPNIPFYDYAVDAAEDEAVAKGKNPALARQIAEDELRRSGVPETLTLPMELEIGDDAVRIRVGDHDLTLAEGEWSDWLDMRFAFNRFVKVTGIGRFKVESLSPDTKLYLSPLHFDPRAVPPFVHISHPHGFLAELAAELGPFKTMGWSIDTWSLEEERISDDTFLEDVDESIRHFESMFDAFIEDDGVELYTQVFNFTDRVQHMLWHYRDPGHARYDAERAKIYEPKILDAYVKMDRIVGDAMAKLDEDTHLIVLSDHGFATWRRAVNLNTWLAKNGFMTLTGEGTRQDLEALFDRGSFWPNVDWSRTEAFALGLGYVYINVLGREPEGTVLPGDEYDRVCREISEGLENLVDPETGLHPVSKVYRRDEIYREGYDPKLIPDLRVCNTPGYRVSWQSSLGNTPAEVFYTKDKNWSGDHCSLDPAFVKGILFTSFPIDSDEPWIGDMFATICALLELDAPEHVHGRSLVD